MSTSPRAAIASPRWSSLNGTAKLVFADGAIRGLSVAKMLRNLTTGILTGWQYDEEAKTVFTALGASFTLANGQAQTDDLRLSGPLVSMGGGGTVDLPAEALKFRVNPLMLASVEGDGGKNRLLGFPVPVAISGPWSEPLFYPDIVGILDHPVAAYEQLNKLGGGLIAVPANLIGIDTGREGSRRDPGRDCPCRGPWQKARSRVSAPSSVTSSRTMRFPPRPPPGKRPAADGGAVAATATEAEAKPAPTPPLPLPQPTR